MSARAYTLQVDVLHRSGHHSSIPAHCRRWLADFQHSRRQSTDRILRCRSIRESAQCCKRKFRHRDWGARYRFKMSNLRLIHYWRKRRTTQPALPTH